LNKTIVLVLVLLAIPIVSAEYLTDRIYCKNFGTCDINNLKVQNLSVVGSYLNVTVINYNITGGVTATSINTTNEITTQNMTIYDSLSVYKLYTVQLIKAG
jgi:hypothetical protein